MTVGAYPSFPGPFFRLLSLVTYILQKYVVHRDCTGFHPSQIGYSRAESAHVCFLDQALNRFGCVKRDIEQGAFDLVGHRTRQTWSVGSNTAR